MSPDKIAVKYLDAWNQRDLSGLLDIMHSGAAYYDAFWRETCVGRDLRQYFVDSFEEDLYTYRVIGDFNVVENGVWYRYSAHDKDVAKGSEVIFVGADVLTIVDDKIVTVSEFYCHPYDGAFDEVTQLEIRRHGRSRYATSGLATHRSLSLVKQLGELLQNRRKSGDEDITAEQLAGHLGCSLDHLFQVVELIINSDEIEIDGEQKADLANHLLKKDLPEN